MVRSSVLTYFLFANTLDVAAGAPKKFLGLAGDASQWVAEHNKYRCMHGVPPLKWSEALAKGAKDYIWENPKLHQGNLEHSENHYSEWVAAENLYYYWTSGNGKATPADSVKEWYEESDDCKGGAEKFTDGCAHGVGGKMVGHFTAMIWKGAKEIGCATNKHGTVTICRYKAGDTFSLDTPNVNDHSGGNYKNHVFPRSKNEEQCK